MALLELGAGRGEQDERQPRGVVDEVGQEGDERVVGPVEVLDDEDGWTALRDLLEEAAPGGERLLLGRRFRGRLEADEGCQAILHPGAHGWIGLREDRVELGPQGCLVVGVEDPGVAPHDLPECPEADAIAVGQASALPLRVTGSSVTYRKVRAVDAYVASPTTIPSTGAIPWSRAARFTPSPMRSSSCAAGYPKTAIPASPTIRASVPP